MNLTKKTLYVWSQEIYDQPRFKALGAIHYEYMIKALKHILAL